MNGVIKAPEGLIADLRPEGLAPAELSPAILQKLRANAPASTARRRATGVIPRETLMPSEFAPRSQAAGSIVAEARFRWSDSFRPVTSPAPALQRAQVASPEIQPLGLTPSLPLGPPIFFDGNGEPRVIPGKIPKDEVPKPSEEDREPPKQGIPSEGIPSVWDFPKEPVDSDNHTRTSAPTKTDGGPVLVQGSDEDNFKDWWEGTPELPADKVELMCTQKVRHRIHIYWVESGTIAQTPDLEDAKKLSKGKLAVSSAKAIANESVGSGVLDKKVREFLVDVKGWKCEEGCKLITSVIAYQYSVKIGTEIGEVVDLNKRHVGWLAMYYVVHELSAIVEIECKR